MRAVIASRAGGMSLIEMLVAVLVVGIGLMGVASLIVESVRNGHVALLRTQVINLVSDMQERIRANPGAGEAYACAFYSGGPSIRNCAPSGAGAAGRNCTASELAEDDLAQWQSAVRLTLPIAGRDVCEANVVYAAPGRSSDPAKYRVSISWLQRGGDAPLTYESELAIAPVLAR